MINLTFFYYLIYASIAVFFLVQILRNENINRLLLRLWNYRFVLPFICILFLAFIIANWFLTISKFNGPNALFDEYFYLKEAKLIFTLGNFRASSEGIVEYPFLYALLVSPSFIFSNPLYSYKVALGIGLLTMLSSIIPMYLIARRHISSKLSLLVSVAVVILPVMVYRTFTVMSENLFIVLYLWLFHFLLLIIEKQQVRHVIIATCIAICLFLTKVIGAAAIVSLMAFLFVNFFYSILRGRQKNKYAQIKFIVAAAVVCLLFFVVSYLTSGENVLSVSSMGYENRGASYLSSLQFLFRKQTVLMALNEINYLMFATQIVPFVVFIISIFSYKYLKLLKKELLVFAVIALPSVGMAMLSMLKGYWFLHRESYLIMGRYIDHLVPFIVLFAFISVCHRVKIGDRLMHYLLISGLLLAVFCIPLGQISNKHNLVGIVFFAKMDHGLLVAFECFLFVMLAFLSSQTANALKLKVFAFMSIIFCSSIINRYFQNDLIKFNVGNYSLHTANIAHYLSQNVSSDEAILYDNQDFLKSNWTYFAYKSIVNNQIEHATIDFKSFAQQSSGGYDLIVSSQKLPCQELVLENDGKYLYDCDAI